MRTFFSVAPDHETAVSISRWCELCWPALNRRIPVQNYHITMAYLGDTDERALESISEMLDDFTHRSFTVMLTETGFHTGSEVLWLVPSVVPDELATLGKTCRQVANRIGVRGGSKRFVPHLTLARNLTNPPPAPLIEPDFSFVVDSLELWSSVRTPEGARYSTVGTWELN